MKSENTNERKLKHKTIRKYERKNERNKERKKNCVFGLMLYFGSFDKISFVLIFVGVKYN